ncbi:MAG: hypothetical protein R3B46_06420 [Phycisphaerales bacterium]
MCTCRFVKPDEGRGLAYYDGKLELEQHLRRLGVPHSVVRPGVLFGRGDILVNNIVGAPSPADLRGVRRRAVQTPADARR